MITLLIVGKVNPRVAERLQGHDFEILSLPSGNAAEITTVMADKVSGVAVSGNLSASIMDALPNLKIVANFGVGYDGVDVRHAASKGIIVTNTPDVLDEEVADTTIGLLLNTLRLFPRAENYLRDGRWVKEGGYPLSPLTLRGRHIGMYGMGRIGQQIAHRLEAFNVRISYHTRSPKKDVSFGYYGSLKELATAVDTLICIVPKTSETRQTVNKEIFEALGANGVMINVGRGWTVHEDDLADALENKVIAGAGLDVFEVEPCLPERLMQFENVSLLPHVASASVATRNAMADLVADNLISWFEQGKPVTPVAETPFRS
ncbi:2-hydroxyacid dehydrogenase [Rhizobium sp.]